MNTNPPYHAPASSPIELDVQDIQSFILNPVAFPFARYCFFTFSDPTGARAFISEISPLVTDAVHRCPVPHAPITESKPWEVSIGLSFKGLQALELPARTLASFPIEFSQGMLARAHDLLVDRGESDPANWEAMWKDGSVHAWVAIQTTTLLANDDPGGPPVVEGKSKREELHATILAAAQRHGVIQRDVQDAGALVVEGSPDPTDREHFGYSDGIGNPDIQGSGWPSPPGSGKRTKQGWEPLAAGEFVLGHSDEAGEMPTAPLPFGLSRNGSFMVYRKLHENVGQFRRWLQAEGERYPGGVELLAAKMIGRFRDGTPLVRSPDAAYGVTSESRADPNFAPKLTDFTYADDAEGSRCPMGAHIRRMNPRDSLGFDGVLVNRRRIIRRGLPYGDWVREDTPLDAADELDRCSDTEPSRHGVIFMAVNASIERQFEFVQREWMNYGNDFRQGNDRDPLLGNRQDESRFVVQGEAKEGRLRPMHICRGLPQFVTVRGGEYFFLPSLTALGMLGSGVVEQS
jgi:Dyp-type peroxidase family